MKIIINGVQAEIPIGPAYTAGEGIAIEGGTIGVTTPVKVMTQAEYDALPDKENSGFCIITDSNVNLNSQGKVYSTEETLIGTWIDGKPLYRITIEFIGPPQLSSWFAFADIKNLNFIASMTGIIQGLGSSGNEDQVIPRDSVYLGKANGKPSIFVTDAACVNKKVFITLEYTKNIDASEAAT